MKHESEKPESGFLLRVSGRTQGVGFRYWTQSTAARLRLKGWVRNESDGTVSCACQGEAAAVNEFVKALRRGPPLARVDKIDTQHLPAGYIFKRFEILH